MAAGPFVFPTRAEFNFLGVNGLLSASAANFKLALITSAWVPNNATDEVFADMSSNEIASANGYAAGGIALTGVSFSIVAGVIRFTSSSAQWIASGGNIAAWRRGVIYFNGALNGKTNPIVGHFLGDATPADVPATTPGNPLTITPNSSGILQAV